jgi:Family of unknown function (DUF6232)
MPEAPVIFRDKSVVVSTTLVQVGNTSYPVNEIVSVSIRKPTNIVAILIGGSLVLGGLMNIKSESGFGVTVIVFGAIVLVLTFTEASELIIKTAGADITLLSSRNSEYLLKIKGSIEQAVAQRG